MSREHKNLPYNSVDKTGFKEVSSMQLIAPLDKLFPFNVSVEVNEKKKSVRLKMRDGKKIVKDITLSQGCLIQLAKDLLLK